MAPSARNATARTRPRAGARLPFPPIPRPSPLTTFHTAPHDLFGLNFTSSEISFGIFGFLLVLMMVARPAGLVPERRRKLELTEGLGTDESLYEVSA